MNSVDTVDLIPGKCIKTLTGNQTNLGLGEYMLIISRNENR